jgi:hypothetical protein
MSTMIGKLERVTLREVFPHEAQSLTRWLFDNPDVLSDALGRNVQIRHREHAVGSFYSDLIAEDDDGNIIIFENQLEKSNHDHLGKILTYVAGTDAKIAVWIVTEARPEHISAINWLNETALCSFYVFKIEAVKIGNSPPAPLLTKITWPSEELVASGQEKKELEERHVERQAFWTTLLPISNLKTKLFANASPHHSGSMWAGSGKAGIGYAYRLTADDIRVELYFGGSDADRNEANFKRMLQHRDEIEKQFGKQLDWDDMGEAKACRIRYVLRGGGYKADRQKWPELAEAAATELARLESATRPFL